MRIRDDDDDTLETSALFLQRLFRGRCDQNDMYNGRTKRQDLIDELKLRTDITQEQSQAPTKTQDHAAIVNFFDYSVIAKLSN